MKRIHYAFFLTLFCAPFFNTSDAKAALITGLADKCLDVLGSNTSDGTPVIIFHCTGTFNQQWNVVNGQIVGIGNKCLDTVGSNTADGTKLQIFTCNGSLSQLWTIFGGSISGGSASKCVEIPSFNTADLTRVQLVGCNPRAGGGVAPNQRWILR